jgi:hypothetical protein
MRSGRAMSEVGKPATEPPQEGQNHLDETALPMLSQQLTFARFRTILPLYTWEQPKKEGKTCAIAFDATARLFPQQSHDPKEGGDEWRPS